MDTVTEFCLLGPVLVRRDGVTVPVAPGKQRAVLAALLLSADRAVSFDELIEVLWGAAAPPSARVSLQNHVMRLRKALGAAARIRTQPDGYQIRVDDGELDVSRFEAHLAGARVAARDGSWDTAAEQAQAGLALWRGEPLADVESDLLATRHIPRFAELRLQAVEVRLDADLHLGRHAEMITEAQRLAMAHPLRERLHGLLMRALYQDGRQAEALAAYARARQILVDELGTEPAAGLREVHRQILNGDPALDLPAKPPGAANSPAPLVPRQLPAAVSGFTGRAAELEALTRTLDEASADSPGTVVISAIGGMAGVGKTALALHWAHLVAGRFPDGQLYVNLRGFDPSGAPPAPGEAIRGFLHGLGVPPESVPPIPDAQAALYRSLMAGRRMLVVLDNAREEQQVRPLLPASAGSLILITSRSELAGLAVADGARLLSLDILPEPEARQLLAGRVGRARAVAEPDAVAQIASLCSCLPLALAVAAARAAARPGLPLAALAAELRDTRSPLDALDAGDPAASVSAVFSWSYDDLDAGSAHAFRMVGLHPGPDFDAYGLAALIGNTPEQAHRVLDTLARAHLIHPIAAGRYGMHDLLRAYARERARAVDSQDEQDAALARLFDHSLYSFARALMPACAPALGPRPDPPGPPADAPVQPLDHPDAALDLLEAQRPTLVAIATHTARHGWPGSSLLAPLMLRDLDVGGYSPGATAIGGKGRMAAPGRQRGAEATALYYLAGIDWRHGRYGQAESRLHDALALYRDAGDPEGTARALAGLGQVEYERGSYEEAGSLLQQAIDMHRENGAQVSEAVAVCKLANVYERQGRHEQGEASYQRALAMFREAGNARGEAVALDRLGVIELRHGHFDRAAAKHHRALTLFREVNDVMNETVVLAHLGHLELRRGNLREAITRLRAAADLERALYQLREATETLNNLGRALLANGQPALGQAEYSAALSLARQIGDKHEEARAHDGLGDCQHASGEIGSARDHWQQALARYAELDLPDAGEARAKIVGAAAAQGSPQQM